MIQESQFIPRNGHCDSLRTYTASLGITLETAIAAAVQA